MVCAFLSPVYVAPDLDRAFQALDTASVQPYSLFPSSPSFVGV
jgi:hypothetical protein